MENNNYNYQQPQTYQYQPFDPNYAEKSKGFLTRAIVMGAISSLPVASIIAIFKAKKNREEILEYIGNGGPHTPKIKCCSALSRAAFYSGIGFTIFWAVYIMIYVIVALGMIAAAAASAF